MRYEADVMANGVQGWAEFSDCDLYRYRLTRTWADAAPRLLVIMLNPSTATALVDDPTVRRCQGFARREGFGGIEVLNLYAFRATDPKDMLRCEDPVGPDNDRTIVDALRREAARGNPVLCAWGVNAKPDRVEWLLRVAREAGALPLLRTLGETKALLPKHPLYVRGDTPLAPWSQAVLCDA